MLFKIDPRIFRDYPGVVIGVVVAHDVDNNKNGDGIQDLLQKEQARIAKVFVQQNPADHPYIMPWRQAFKKFGVTSDKYKSSIENLVTRIREGNRIRSISPLVDLYNIISLKYLIPAGGEDLDTIEGIIELTYAGKEEKPVVLLGESKASVPEVGEVIYKDKNGAICRRWNWKEADRTKLTANTKHAVFVLEALPPVSKETVEMAMHDLAGLIEEYCGGKATVAICDDSHQEIVLKKDKYIDLSPRKLISKMTPVTQVVQDVEEHSKHTIGASEEHKIRLEKLQAMRVAGIDPWPPLKSINATCKDVTEEFKEGIESRRYEIAGRVVALRAHGKSVFAHIQDYSGKLQVYIKQDVIGDASFEQFNTFIDIGDIVWFAGASFKTKTGEVTLKVDAWQLLSKCLHPLPEKFHGLHDVEIKYRQRYLDLISSAESRERFIKRSQIIRAMRQFFDTHGFIEVETPMLHPIPGGAEAKPFITHHNALHMDLYLRIAPELYLKRLIIGGLERVYEINRCFRNEGISVKHNPEFTSVEWYVAYHDYMWMMDFVEELFKTVVKANGEQMQVTYGERTIDFGKPFIRMTMQDAVMQHTGCSAFDLAEKKIDTLLKKYGITIEKKNASVGEKLYTLFDTLVEPALIQPTFITQFPVEISPLAKRNKTNPQFVDRFELFIAGMELSNAFTELNDPFDQAARFKEQMQSRAAGNEEAHYYDADYVLSLEHALPPTVGAAIGIDRLTMLLTNASSIRDVILFPTLKRKKE